MLLPLLTDERCHTRTLADRRIIESREIGLDDNCVRRFIIPAVNFRATDYVVLTDWQTCNVTPPPVLRHVSSHELLNVIQEDVPMEAGNLLNFLQTRKQLSEL
ncbi:hypothetical protein AVEN_164493-1 [Araneus ventricosus]|uniref:Uncharacterized protein n=1 Tax=Araneus ventricosus TaxID=182803 RepID=A0A4Y2QIM6_ARAVE|nr:hypothetical protein AVEN_164493-1 [Araneus ventricosus]